MRNPKLNQQRRSDNNNNIFLHIHSSKIHQFSLRWNYTFGLGIMCLGLFAILSLSGFLLMLYYKPDAGKAYFSVKDLMYVVPSGRLVRNIHRWAGHLMVIACFLHMARVFYTSAYKRGRALNWNIGIVLFLLTLSLNFTGYLLPWDQLAYWAGTIGVNIAASPAQLTDALGITRFVDIGAAVKHLLLGSDQIGNEALVRFFVSHCLVLPLLLVVFIGIHIWRVRKSGGLSRPDRIEPEWLPGPAGNEMVPAIPHAFYREFTALMFILAITVVLAFFFDAPLREPANPLVPENPAKAPWYFLGIQELVSYSAFTGGIGIPLATLFALSIIPYFDCENEGFGRWFGSPKGARITVFSAIYTIICCVSMLVLVVSFDWPGAWPGGIGQFVVHFINPGSMLMLMFLGWSIFVFKRYNSNRLGAMALFTCFFIAVAVLTYFAWGHRGPNWDFYWWPLSWQHH
jgi:quinol-cytochrome oxidoreductase complex cytochrome b subunit